MVLCSNLGALQFAFAWVWHGEAPEFDSRPMLLCEGGAVGVARLGDEEFLVLDHRAEPAGVARIEVWTATGSCEGDAPDLLLIGEVRPGAVAAEASFCDVLMQRQARRRTLGAQGGCTG